jgi:predicted MFS family arabinose efflux permease
LSAISNHPALAPFRVRSFRFQWPADLLTSWAFEMETLILGWYVLVQTGSVLMLTVFGALQFIGTLIAPMMGVIGDRIGQRNLMSGMRAVYATLAAAITMLAFANMLNPMLVLALAALTGIVRPSDMGMRAALVAESMPPTQLAAAAGISRTTSDSARIAGALLGAGLFASLGMGPAYAAVACFYLLGLLFTLGVANVRPQYSPPDAVALSPPRLSAWSDLRDGVRYVWTTPHLQAAMWIAFLVNMTAFPLSGGLLPYVARAVYGTDQTGLGYLVAGFAFGGLLGSITVSVLSARIHPGRAVTIFGILWYVLLLVFSQTQNEHQGIVILMLAGFMQSLNMVPLTVILLRTSNERFRGRVMGVRMLAIYSLPFGLLGAGALIERIGFSGTAALYSLFGLACTLLIALRWRDHLWRLDAPANVR